jgi:methanethiol S-methyltransferase
MTGLLGRSVAFAYGLACYAVFFVTFLYYVGFVSDLVVPKTINTGPPVPAAQALVINLLLIALFGIQHSVMARRSFKQWWTQFIPPAVERSTYVLLTSLALIVLFWLWRPMPELVWHIAEPTIAAAVTGLAIIGWLIALTSTFLINHFELFGLQQVTNNLTGHAASEPHFLTPLYYRLVRHPLYFGFLIAFWATPAMSVGHLVFAAANTVYIVIGAYFEERDLVALFGDQYRTYQARVSMLVPWRRG